MDIVQLRGDKMYKFKTHTKIKVSVNENYNELLLVELINFKKNYEKQLEKYFNEIYLSNKDLKDFLEDELYLYEMDRVILNWYYNESKDIFENLIQDMLLNDIIEETYIQITSILEGLIRIFNILWERDPENRMNDIYNWLMEVPYILSKKIGQILVQGKVKEDSKLNVKYNQNTYDGNGKDYFAEYEILAS